MTYRLEKNEEDNVLLALLLLLLLLLLLVLTLLVLTTGSGGILFTLLLLLLLTTTIDGVLRSPCLAVNARIVLKNCSPNLFDFALPTPFTVSSSSTVCGMTVAISISEAFVNTIHTCCMFKFFATDERNRDNSAYVRYHQKKSKLMW